MLRKAILQQQRLMELLSLPLLKSKPVLMALLMAKRGERRWLRRNLAPAVERRNASDLAPEKEKGLVLGLAVNVLSALAPVANVGDDRALEIEDEAEQDPETGGDPALETTSIRRVRRKERAARIVIRRRIKNPSPETMTKRKLATKILNPPKKKN